MDGPEGPRVTGPEEMADWFHAEIGGLRMDYLGARRS